MKYINLGLNKELKILNYFNGGFVYTVIKLFHKYIKNRLITETMISSIYIYDVLKAYYAQLNYHTLRCERIL